jgi:hypothetical protein
MSVASADLWKELCAEESRYRRVSRVMRYGFSEAMASDILDVLEEIGAEQSQGDAAEQSSQS